MHTEPPLLSIDRFSLDGGSPRDPLPLLRDVSLQLRRGELVGLVGESGSGKSLTAFATMGLLPIDGRRGLRQVAGSIHLGAERLDTLDESGWRRVRAKRIAMAFQEPMTALNPTRRVRSLMGDVLAAHQPLAPTAARKAMLDSLQAMDVPDPDRVLDAWPFQLSGGLRQRVLLATTLLCEPELLIADEITTALDVTVQAQVLSLLVRAARERQLAVLFISHDLALVRHTCERVAVMFRGRIVEQGPTADLVERPRHPYTQALLAALPERGQRRRPLLATKVSTGVGSAGGCSYATRCALTSARCAVMPGLDVTQRHAVRCWHAEVTP